MIFERRLSRDLKVSVYLRMGLHAAHGLDLTLEEKVFLNRMAQGERQPIRSETFARRTPTDVASDVALHEFSLDFESLVLGEGYTSMRL